MNHPDAVRDETSGRTVHIPAHLAASRAGGLGATGTLISAAAFFPEVLRNPAAWLILLFGVAPVAFNTFTTSFDLQALLLSGYFTLAWAAYFYICVGRRAVNLWLGLASALFMLFVGVPVGRFLHFNVLLVFYGMTTSPSALVQWVGNILSHGLNEEVMKAVSVLLLAFPLRQIRKPIDGVFYGALSGLGFAAWEGHKLIAEAQTPAVMMTTVAVRSVTNCLLHASWTGISGYFIALGALSGRRLGLSMLGMSIAILLHGSFDFRADVREGFPVSLLLAALAYLFFECCVLSSYNMAEERGERRVAQAETAPAARS